MKLMSEFSVRIIPEESQSPVEAEDGSVLVYDRAKERIVCVPLAEFAGRLPKPVDVPITEPKPKAKRAAPAKPKRRKR
jgi:hypothetical protein